MRKGGGKTFIRKTENNRSRLYISLGYLGLLLFVFDFIRLNGMMAVVKSSYDISIIGSVGSLLVPILLVEGLYNFGNKLVNEKKIDFKALIMLVSYSIPCLLNSGRESVLYIIIGIVVMLGYNSIITNKKAKKSYRVLRFKYKSLFSKTVLFIIAIILIRLIVQVSADRYGINEINTYLRTRSVSYETIQEAEKFGDFKFLYYNIVSYFGHQIPFLEFMFKEYRGPYLFGMYELNIISRRLPSFLGLDYSLAYTQLNTLFSSTGEGFSACWQTVLGSFIIDFSPYVTPVVCGIIGFIVGKVRRKFLKTYDIRYAVLIALICISMFTTIQIGPFYNALVYGTFIWWNIVFHKDEGYIDLKSAEISN